MWTKLWRTNREKILITYGERMAAFRNTYKVQKIPQHLLKNQYSKNTINNSMEILYTAK